MRATVVKKVSFDAAHYLPDYPGKCAALHGHRWTVEAGVVGEVKGNGMVIDFAILGGLLGTMLNGLDHTYLNDVIPNPTAENICRYVKDWIGDSLNEAGVEIAFIRVHETPDSYAEWRHELV